MKRKKGKILARSTSLSSIIKKCKLSNNIYPSIREGLSASLTPHTHARLGFELMRRIELLKLNKRKLGKMREEKLFPLLFPPFTFGLLPPIHSTGMERYVKPESV
jgi:hypothetical protein